MDISLVVSDKWAIYEIDGTGCTMLDIINKHNIAAAKFLPVLEHVAKSKTGPLSLPKHMSHEFDKKNSMYEFVFSKRLRIVYFIDEGKVVICTHTLYKKDQVISKKDKIKAAKFKKNYFKSKKDSTLIKKV